MCESLNNLSPNIPINAISVCIQRICKYFMFRSNTVFLIFSKLSSWPCRQRWGGRNKSVLYGTGCHLSAASDKLRKRQMWSQVSSGLTWVYTVETTFVDTLKTAFPPSTHFTSAPFCSTAWGLKKERGNHLQAVLALQACYFFFHSLLPFSSRCWLPWCCWLPWSPSTRAAGCTRPGC